MIEDFKECHKEAEQLRSSGLSASEIKKVKLEYYSTGYKARQVYHTYIARMVNIEIGFQ